MIKLPKKIAKTIKRELNSNFTVIKRVHIYSIFKQSCVDLIVFTTKKLRSFIILRFFGDNSYDFIANYTTLKEIEEELAFQVKKLC